MADIDPGGIQVEQGNSPADVEIGRGQNANGAVALASSLGDASPEIHDFLTQLGGQLQARQEAKAQADAFSQSGKPLADAVRDGTIEPTQNPWYIRAYNQDSAQLRGQADVSALVDQSQTWAERSDPVAYQQRFTKELGDIATNYQQHPETLQGFETAASPLYKQAIASNQEYNVQRITQEHQQNVSTLMTQAVQDAAKANGGVLTPEAAQAALKPFVDQWVATGGTTPQARTMMLNSIVGAAANTGNVSLTNVLDQDFDGHGALANMTGPDGQPVATNLLRDKYYIDRLATQQGSAEQKAHQAKVMQEGIQGYSQILAAHGYDFITGKVPASQIFQELQQSGLSAEGAGEAARLLKEDLAGASGLATDLTGMHDLNPDLQTSVANMTIRAAREGLTKDFQADVLDGIRKGTWSVADADKMIAMASKTSDRQVSDARSDAREARSDSRADARMSRQQQQQDAKDAHDYVDYAVGAVATRAAQGNDRAYITNPQLRTQLTFAARLAQGAYAHSHPGESPNSAGAQAAVDTAVTQFQARRRPGGKPPPPTSAPGKPNTGNPLGGSY